MSLLRGIGSTGLASFIGDSPAGRGGAVAVTVSEAGSIGNATHGGGRAFWANCRRSGHLPGKFAQTRGNPAGRFGARGIESCPRAIWGRGGDGNRGLAQSGGDAAGAGGAPGRQAVSLGKARRRIPAAELARGRRRCHRARRHAARQWAEVRRSRPAARAQRAEMGRRRLRHQAAGGVTVPVYTTNTPANHAHILSDSGAEMAVVATAALAKSFFEAARKVEAPETRRRHGAVRRRRHRQRRRYPVGRRARRRARGRARKSRPRRAPSRRRRSPASSTLLEPAAIRKA